jgi:hypothetical protein
MKAILVENAELHDVYQIKQGAIKTFFHPRTFFINTKDRA